MALHELATNAAKYGALSKPEGRMQVTWSKLPPEPFVLRWTEADGPRVTVPERNGFGTRVIQTMIQQSGGEVRFQWSAGGLVCEILLPDLQAAPAALQEVGRLYEVGTIAQ